METPELLVYLDKRGKNKEETPLVCFSYKMISLGTQKESSRGREEME